MLKQDIISDTMASKSAVTDKLTSDIASLSTLEQDTACLTLGHAGTMASSPNMPFSGQSIPSKETTGLPLPCEIRKEHGKSNANLLNLGVDLCTIDNSSAVENNPFHPFKAVGQFKHADASECGSTTGPIEESEPLRLWKEMKQNGFLSSSHGGIPVPKQQVRQPKKRKTDEVKKRKDDLLKKKVDSVKKEHANKHSKFAAPSGLLSGLNPGIINHVRNSKQVHSIIEAIIRSEKLDCEAQRKDNMRGTKERREQRADFSCADYSEVNQICISSLPMPAVTPTVEYKGEHSGIESVRHDFHQRTYMHVPMDMDCDGDVLALKLSPAATSIPGNGNSSDEVTGNKEPINALSLKAATVASQWLDLLQQDIKGRLSALRRSKKRVRNAIQTELPYLLSTEFMCSQENVPDFAHSSAAGCSRKATIDMHVARWKALFSQMDKALYEEGKHLESWLKQVEDMQLHCENGLKFIGLSHLDSSIGSSKLKTYEATERESAVLAAAASIYSTCNLITTTENVSCF